MSKTFRFAIPVGTREVQPVLRLEGEVGERKLVLLFDVERPAGVTLNDEALGWSDTLQARFRYVPPAQSSGVVKMKPFSLPSKAERLRVQVHAWEASASIVLSEMALVAVWGDEPVVIFAEESTA